MEFNDNAKKDIKRDLSRMLDFIECLDKVDTDGVEALIFMSDEINVFREDEIEVNVTQKEALQNAPQHDSDYFKVPKVLSKNRLGERSTKLEVIFSNFQLPTSSSKTRRKSFSNGLQSYHEFFLQYGVFQPYELIYHL